MKEEIDMAGFTGYDHTCSEEKIAKTDHKCPLRNSSFSDAECRIVWDFYVSRSFAAATGLRVELSDYGWNNSQSKTDGLPALEKMLAEAAGIESFCIVRSKTVKDTLWQMGLSQDRICTVHPRDVMLQNYHVDIDENEKPKIESDESRINSIFRHIRNSLAHGNTYFFPNEMCLLEDKDGATKITAEILIPCKALISWIGIVDKEHRYYNI